MKNKTNIIIILLLVFSVIIVFSYASAVSGVIKYTIEDPITDKTIKIERIRMVVAEPQLEPTLGISRQNHKDTATEVEPKPERKQVKAVMLTGIDIKVEVEETQATKAVITEAEQTYITVIAKVTAYSPFDNQSGICNDGDPNNTSTGKYPQHKYIAVDPKKIPYGTKVRIEGINMDLYAEDTGSALRSYDGYAIDIFVDTYDEAYKWGVQYLEAKIYK